MTRATIGIFPPYSPEDLLSFIDGDGRAQHTRDELTSILDAMDAEHGPPNKVARAWAKRVLKRRSF